MEYLQELTLELNSNTAYSTVGAKQGDNGTRVIHAYITSNGVPYNLREHSINLVYFRLRKPDGKAVINTATISNDGSYVEFALTAQALSVAGRGYADLTFMSGSDILSTVSFILIIMASPQVAAEATSSNEFGFLNAVVSDALHTIHEAEAWAAGTRDGQPVYTEDDFQYYYESNVIDSLTVNKSTFIGKPDIGSTPGLHRIFTFSYVDSNIWNLVVTTYDGDSKSETDPVSISNIGGYGITFGTTNQVPPDDGDKIIIDVKEPDAAANNNAKYYAEQAAIQKNAILNLTVSAETVLDVEHGGEAEVIKTIEEGVDHLHFKIPKGDTGDVNFMTFDVDTTSGQLMMYRPDHVAPQLDFNIDNNGNLCVLIQSIMNGGSD